MKSFLAVNVIFAAAFLTEAAFGNGYDLTVATFLGGSGGEFIRDVETDAAGNIYVAGTTHSADFPTTAGAFDEKLDTSQGQSDFGYSTDIFVAKFGPEGKLVWSTLVGGPGSEEAYGLEIDSKGYVVVHGRGAEGSPVTEGVYQKEFKGYGGGDTGNPHGTAQNAYICKLKPDGSAIVWASFFGIDHLHRDLALDKNDDIYTVWGVREGKKNAHWDTWMKSQWNATAFRPKPLGGDDCGVAKIASDGSKVIWATYMGGSGNDSLAASIRVDDKGCAYVCFDSSSTDLPTTEGAFSRTKGGGSDWYVAKLKADGSDIIYGTYIGDEGDNWINTHNLAIDSAGCCYTSTCAFSSNFPTTDGVIQRIYGGGRLDWGIIKLSPTGGLAACTLLGGKQADNSDGIRVDKDGNLVLFGQTDSADFPVSADAWQRLKDEADDAVIVKLSPDLDEVLYATFIGGSKSDVGRAGCVDKDGNIIIAGFTEGGSFPLKSAYQDSARGPSDAFIAKFSAQN
jgi:hypothetical protein